MNGPFLNTNSFRSAARFEVGGLDWLEFRVLDGFFKALANLQRVQSATIYSHC
jgi:hypothetical protein